MTAYGERLSRMSYYKEYLSQPRNCLHDQGEEFSTPASCYY
jgi:hypothetical protein